MLVGFRVLMFTAIFCFLQGCVAVQTFPNVARAGDTITLALGSVDGLDKSKLTLAYIPQSTGVPIDITSSVRSVLKVYPDRTSSASMSDAWTSNLTVFSGHAMWMNVAVVDLPVTLPTGPGYFQVDFADSVRVPASNVITSAESKHIVTEILAGSGAPNNFSYYAMAGAASQPVNFNRLEPLPHVVLRPALSGNYGFGGVHPAAAEYRIKLPINGNQQTLDASELHVIWDYKPGEDNKQIELNWHHDNDVITVNVLVPTDLTLVEQQVQFSIVIDPSYADNIVDIHGTPQLLSQRFWDLNGNEMTAQLTPEVIVMK